VNEENLHDEAIHGFYYSPNIVRATESTRVRNAAVWKGVYVQDCNGKTERRGGKLVKRGRRIGG
jgi:hypothetical protein